MAKEISRTFDLDHGCVIVGIRDSFGKDSFHTIYVAGVEDVDADVTQRLAEVEAQAEEVRARMIKAGWKP